MQLDRLWTMDPRALNHIMTHSVDYQKPSQARRNLARILGTGENVCCLLLVDVNTQNSF